MFFPDIVIGTGTGLITSFFIWFAFTRLVRPKLKLSTNISMTRSLVKETSLFRIKVENLSCFRVYDLCFTGRIKVYNLLKDFPNKPLIYVLNIGAGSHPYIENRYESKSLTNSGRELLIRPTGTTIRELSFLWEKPKEEVNIETILKKDPRNSIEISVTATHGFSGAKRIYTQQYQFNSLRPLFFSPKGVELRPKDNSYNAIEW